MARDATLAEKVVKFQNGGVNENHGTINMNFHTDPMPLDTRKPEVKQTVSIDRDLKKWVNDIATAYSEATGNNQYGASSVGREALLFYREFYSIHRKTLKYKEAIFALLKSLP